MALGAQHQLVESPLLPAKPPVDGESAGDVGVVVVHQAATGINEQQIPVPQRILIVGVVEDAGVVSPRHDGGISGLARPGVAEVALQQGLNLVFPHARLGRLPGLFMGSATDAGRFPHPLQLPRLLAETHGVDGGAHVEEAGGVSPVPLAPLQLLGPDPQHQRFHMGMATNTKANASCAVEIAVQVFSQLPQGMGRLGAEVLHGAFHPPALAVPHFSSGIPWLYKQHEARIPGAA